MKINDRVIIKNVKDKRKLHWPYAGNGIMVEPGRTGIVTGFRNKYPLVLFDGESVSVEIRHNQVKKVEP